MVTKDVVYQGLEQKYSEHTYDHRYAQFYESEDVRLRPVFACMHDKLNSLLKFMNEKKDRGGHYNAHESRELLDLIRDIGELRTALNRVGAELSLASPYEEVLEQSRTFLVRNGGSPIPVDFREVPLEDYEPIFSIGGTSVRLAKTGKDFRLRSIGEGSYARVYRYRDEDYRMDVAVKRAKTGLSDTELLRFKAEYDVLASRSSPYVLTVFGYDEAGPSYAMEYCEFTLGKYMEENNGKANFDFVKRQRIACRFYTGLATSR